MIYYESVSSDYSSIEFFEILKFFHKKTGSLLFFVFSQFAGVIYQRHIFCQFFCVIFYFS
jgi:hypothetical protein